MRKAFLLLISPLIVLLMVPACSSNEGTGGSGSGGSAGT